jgi:MoaA/NifB/PqqE/SkfB family radical SAM enzyme
MPKNYFSNLLRLLGGNPTLRPLVATFYLTAQCNLNCVYCEDFGARRNLQNDRPLPLDEAKKVLRTIRTGMDSLILTGGEPLLVSYLEELVAYARQKLRFRQLTLLTNGTLLAGRERLLAMLDRVVISLDSIDAAYWAGVIGTSQQIADAILKNLCWAAEQQRRLGFVLIINCVLTPQTLPGAGRVLDFCREHGILAAFSPQAVHHWPSYDVLISKEYVDFLDYLMDEKRRGGPVLGSWAYLRTLRQFETFACYPTLNPRIWTDGSLTFPCRPIERDGGEHGGRPCRLQDVETWEEALTLALQRYGQAPQTCTSCFQQCYLEPSLMQAKPLALGRELLTSRVSRQGQLITFAPG